MVEWCNTNQGFLSAILSFIAVCFSGIAIVISVNSTKKQNKIALFDKRLDNYNRLKEYFDSSKGWPKAITKFLSPETRIATDNAWSPEISEIITESSLLFYTGLSNRLLELQEQYKEVRSLDSQISSYFSWLEATSDFNEIKPLFVEYLEGTLPDTEEQPLPSEVKKWLVLTGYERIDMYEQELVTYDFPALYKRQSEICKSIEDSKIGLLDDMRKEIRPEKTKWRVR